MDHKKIAALFVVFALTCAGVSPAMATPRTVTPAVPNMSWFQAPLSNVMCCDGTQSPTCTTAHQGCCSHHGGVC